jgi:hypothetical protein
VCRADFEIDVLAAGFTTQGGVMMRHLSIAIGRNPRTFLFVLILRAKGHSD